MSKQPSNQTRRNLLRRGLAGILLLAMLFGLMPSGVFTARAASWADPYVETLVDWGVMRGDIGGNMAPDRSITRAEFVAMMNRAYGYSNLGGNPFTDVRVQDWYYEDIDIGYNIGYFKGTSPTTASPNDTLTREQAAVLLARNMMLQETVGETLGFSDSRQLSEWSRGLVGAAAANGIISGYDDGSFQPFRDITRGEVAAMLVRAIGTPIQTEGEHALGNVYGNVTVNTAGVKLRDGVIVGNLYLTGGIDLGDVLLENVTVLGEIIVSGGGESNSSAASIIMRNVVADNMIVDSIGDQFVTIRAEGNTDIPTTTVRTNAYVDDSSRPGFGLSLITLDGDEGTLLQLAGNIKEVWDRTPGSDLQLVQGTAEKITMDEKATGSSVLVDGDARVDDLNLDVATNVTGTGDIANLNVSAAGSTVEQLPDNITIRPGITADIAGSDMNSSQAAESSSDPKLLAGYPAVKSIAPTSATLVFKTNKTGTIYWAVSAVADGSVGEEDLLEPPVYGGNVLKSGTINATEANKEFTAAVTGLTRDGSYYVTAMLVDGRGEHSPIKVTSFTTPDDTVPAFATGYPYMSKVTCDEAQVTVMTTKSCLLYYALLPDGAAAPTTAEFKAAAIPGNLGYGSMSVTKNVTMPFPVNSFPLDEKTNYVLYLWLTDHDGAKSSSVVPVRFTTPDETPPVVTSIDQTGETTTSIRVTYTIDEPADLVWALVTESDHINKRFLPWIEDNPDPNDEDKTTLKFADEAALLAAKVWLAGGGANAVKAGSGRTNPLNITGIPVSSTSSYVLYYIANDRATDTGNLSLEIKALRVHTTDNVNPTAELLFTNKDQSEVKEEPDSDADVRIVFSENVKGGATKGTNIFLNLYNEVLRCREEYEKDDPNSTTSELYTNYMNAKSNLGATLSNYIVLYRGTSPTGTEVNERKGGQHDTDDEWVIDWRNAEVTMLDDGTGRVEVRLPTVTDASGKATTDSALNLDSGVSYYFRLAGITDLATTNNPLEPTPCFLPFTTAFAKVNLEESDTWTIPGVSDESNGANETSRVDFSFTAKPSTVEKVGENIYWDMLIWSDTSITFTLWRRNLDTNGPWERVNSTPASITVSSTDGWSYVSLWRVVRDYNSTMPPYDQLRVLGDYEWAIHIDSLGGSSNTTYSAWNSSLNIRISYVAGTQNRLFTYVRSGTQSTYDNALANDISSIEQKSPFILNKPFEVMEPPEILDGYPTISVTDTSATITLALDKAGQVYYMVLPMTAMFNDQGTINKSTTTLKEDLVQTINRFNMLYTPVEKDSGDTALPSMVPRMIGDGDVDEIKGKLLVSSPAQDTVITIDSRNTNPQGYAPATAARPRSEIAIDLTDKLDANTVYYIFLVTRSESAIYSPDPVCYRFTTSEPIRPTINVTGGSGASVNISVDKTTKLNYFLAQNGKEGGLFAAKFSTYANDDWYTGTSDARWSSNASGTTWTYTGTDGSYNFTYTQNGGALSEMTVVDAMATPCNQGNTYVGSVFDVFASNTAKNTFAQEIEGATIVGSDIVAKGEKDCTTTSTNNTAFSDLAPGYYTFVCAGKSSQGSGYAFRAYYSIRVTSSSHPQINGVSISKRAFAEGEALTGTVTLYFDSSLYYMETNAEGTRQEVKELDTCNVGNHATSNTDIITLGSIVTTNTTDNPLQVKTDAHAQATKGPDTLTLSFTNLTADTVYFCNFRAGLCNSTGQGAENSLRIQFCINKVRTNPDAPDGDPAVYSYVPELTIVSTQWNGITTG